MNKYLLLLAISILLMSFIAIPALAQDEEMMGYSWGTVKEVSAGKIVVLEYDYDLADELEVSYAIDPDAEFINVNSLKDISSGDVVEIDYAIKNGQKIAKVISVDKRTSEEEYSLPDSEEDYNLPDEE